VNTDDAYQDYLTLREKGWTKTAALAELATYLRPMSLAKLRARLLKSGPVQVAGDWLRPART